MVQGKWKITLVSCLLHIHIYLAGLVTGNKKFSSHFDLAL